MRRQVRLKFAGLTMGLALLCAAIGAAPAPSSYLGVERTIESIRRSWSSPGAPAQPNRPGWDALFDALLGDLKTYATAESDSERQQALDRINQISNSLGAVAWTPAATLRGEIEQWMSPRLRVAWAKRRLSDTVAALPATNDPTIRANRARWLDFVQNDLGNALRDYDSATTVSQRQAALHRLHESLGSLENGNRSRPWSPSWELQTAVNDLFNQPNLDVAIDVNTVSPLFNANLVETGPVFRKGYWSQVTAGPKTGFGLLPSDDGIAFYNKQSLVSVTPITDFQNQIAADDQGRRAAKLYQFSATTYDWSELTITTVLRSSGLTITPSSTHNINAAIWSAPTAGGGLGRGIAALIGLNQDAITEKVKEGAMPRFQQQIPVEAQEEALERIGRETAQRNADLRSKGLVGNNTVAVRDLLITQLSLRSRPDAVFVGGLFQFRDAPGQLGADAQKPSSLAATYEPGGVSALVHLSSLLSSAAAGVYQRDEVKSVDNLMLSVADLPPGTAPRDAVKLTKNVDFATYAKAVDEGRKPGSPRVTVLRITRPPSAPELTVDARGFLVALIHDLQIEVPAPESEARGGVVGAAAKIYRIKIPQAEVALSYQVDSASDKATQLHAKVQDFSPGTNAEVLAIADDEAKAVPLSRFSAAVVLGAIGGRLRTLPIDVRLDQLKLPGFSLRSISPLDPSGWVRVGLLRNPDAPLQLTQTAPPAPAPPAPVSQLASPQPVSLVPTAVGQH
jgi:hypothetical protein